MIDIKSLHPGDRVRIVYMWNNNSNENIDGLMDEYLGAIMTVHKTIPEHNCVEMEEDEQEWWWNGFTIAEVIDDDIQPATQEELFALLMG